MTYRSASVHKTSLNVLRLQPWITFKNGIRRVTGSEHSQNVLYCKAMASDDRLATKYFWIDRNPLKQFIFIHHVCPLNRGALLHHRFRRANLR